MNILKKEYGLCIYCMQEHEIITTSVPTTSRFKNKEVRYSPICFYCSNANDYFEDENMITQNDITFKNEYRKIAHLLTTHEIEEIRNKYGISQSDLCIILGWGAKTITRYESHQIQDAAHDAILRKIGSDPSWFIDMLKSVKEKFSTNTYLKYLNNAYKLYEESQDFYLRKYIGAQYAKYDDVCDDDKLCLDKVIETIQYFASSNNVNNLFKPKLISMLWYADNLAFQQYHKTIAGLKYISLPLNAVPIAIDSILLLKGISYTEITQGEITGKMFVTKKNKYQYLTSKDIDILEKVISELGKLSLLEIQNTIYNKIEIIKEEKNGKTNFLILRDITFS